MNKQELIETTAIKAGLTKKIAGAALDAIMEAITEAVASGDKVTLVGFGTFEPRTRKEREGHNPKTKEPLTIPETVVPTFSAGKLFKGAVAQGEGFEKAA